MLVVNPTPYNIPLNTANVPTESVEIQNKFANRIPEAVPTFETSPRSNVESQRQLSDADRTAKNAEIREKIFGSKQGRSGQPSTEQNDSQVQRTDSQNRQDLRQEIKDRAIIRNLASIDRRVRAHEQAHSSVGGIYAGSPSFTYKTGPNGVRYAVGGEVSIDLSAVPGNPQATLKKAVQVSRAALAPADPSSRDRQVASSAQALATKARFEIARLSAQRLQGNTQAKINGEDIDESGSVGLNTSFSGGKLRAALATDATEQIGGQVSTSA